ncbi:MAG: aldehyde ferredoxin oxidoreductase N-terminal domain-containing protein [Desulfobacterales bacterium]|jgi:aldehyde:ferredoxin oxidoreductase
MPLNRKIAYIDLSSKEIDINPIPREWRSKFLGGRGLNAYLLYKHLPPGCDPLGPDNIITIGSGLLGGTLNMPLAYTDVSAKSPLTRLLGRAALSGFFASEMRWAGFDHLVIKGRAPHPSYLLVDNGQIKIKSAEKLWGNGVFESRETIRNKLGDENVRIICIGPAGENLVRFANLVTDRNQQSGRTGMGAVLGSKNIKAVVCRGRMDLAVKNPAAALAHQGKFMDAALAITDRLAGAKPNGGIELAIGQVVLPGSSLWPADSTGAHDHSVTDLGLDPLVARAMLQWVAALFENKMVADKDSIGLKLGQGDPKTVETMIEQMALRQGLGDILAQGPLRAAGIIGDGSLELLRPVLLLIKMHTEDDFDSLAHTLTPVHFQGSQVQLRRPGREDAHLPGRQNEPPELSDAPVEPVSQGRREEFTGPVGMVSWQELYEMVFNCLGISATKIISFYSHPKHLSPLKELLRLVAGIAPSEKNLRDVAYRCYVLERLFNLRELTAGRNGRRPDDVFDFPAGMRMPLEKWKDIDLKKLNRLVNEYYRSRGWTKTGLLKRAIFQTLELDDLWPLAK